MHKKPGLSPAALIVSLFALLLFTAAAAPQEPKPATAAAPAALTPQERRGKAIYLRGETASGRQFTAFVGELEVPGSTVTCAGCHGARGEGKTEGGVTAGDLTWANLVKPAGHTHPTGRRHGPFDEAAFARAVAKGVDPAGNKMLTTMPRYDLTAEETADLVAYLKRVGREVEPGLTATTIRVGTLVPAKGPLGEAGAAMRDVLNAFFQDLNERGGISGRRVEFLSAEAGDTPAATAERLRRLVEAGQVFALVGGVSAGADRQLAALAAEFEVPYVGPSTLLPEPGVNRFVFYLMPGVAEQARALVNFHAQTRTPAQRRVAVVSAAGELGDAAAAAAAEQCQKASCGPLQRVTYERGKFDAAAVVQSLKEADAVFFFGSGGDEAALLKEADAAGWRPRVFLLGAFAGNLTTSVPAGFKERVFAAFPSVPFDLRPAGVGEFRALLEKYRVPARNTASQVAAFAAAKIFAEGLGRAGRDLTREGLVTALESLYDYETGLTPRVTYGPNRRLGAAGAYVMLVDPEKKEFAATGRWVKAF